MRSISSHHFEADSVISCSSDSYHPPWNFGSDTTFSSIGLNAVSLSESSFTCQHPVYPGPQVGRMTRERTNQTNDESQEWWSVRHDKVFRRRLTDSSSEEPCLLVSGFPNRIEYKQEHSLFEKVGVFQFDLFRCIASSDVTYSADPLLMRITYFRLTQIFCN